MPCRAQSTDLVCTSGLFGGAGRATWTNARCFDVMVPCGCSASRPRAVSASRCPVHVYAVRFLAVQLIRPAACRQDARCIHHPRTAGATCFSLPRTCVIVVWIVVVMVVIVCSGTSG